MTNFMITPDIQSEKAIANYSYKLIESINKTGFKIWDKTYTAGKPLTILRILPQLKNANLIHIQHEYNLLGNYGLPFFILFPYLKLFTKSKIIITMHTVLSQHEKFKGNILKTIFRKILYLTQNKVIKWSSNKTIVHAKFFKDILVNEYKFNPNKVEVIPQGIEEDIKLTAKNIAKKELNIRGNIYLIIGSFVPDHGADIIIEQANKIGKTILIATNPKAVNDRNQKRIKEFIDYNKNIVKKNKSSKYVKFDLGEIPYSSWWKYFSAADLVLLPYKGGIGSGIFADAIASKRPIISSDIPYFQEYSKKFSFIRIAKNNSFSSEIKTAMEPNNYNKMKKGFDEYIMLYGYSSIGKIYRNLYNSLK